MDNLKKFDEIKKAKQTIEDMFANNPAIKQQVEDLAKQIQGIQMNASFAGFQWLPDQLKR